MIRRTLEIRNSLGLHARAAGALVRLSSAFQSEITVEKDGMKANSKSIMGLLMLAAASGSTILVTAQGGDEEEAMAAIEGLVRRNFNES
jgi:phosphocarrier protein HPr